MNIEQTGRAIPADFEMSDLAAVECLQDRNAVLRAGRLSCARISLPSTPRSSC